MRADLEADRALVARTWERILNLERSLPELRAEQAIAQKRLDSYIYPVLTLPNEITSEIFIHFLPPYPICPPLIGMLSPTHLTHICSKWRAVALATPGLWRAIGIYPSHVRRKYISLIYNAWLSRSGSCPLSVEIDEDDTIGVHPTEVLSTLISHRARWEYLLLIVDDHSEDSLNQIKGPIPLLRHIELAYPSHSAPFNLGDLPQLRSVIMNEGTALRVTLPWAQLISLTLCWVEPTVCLPILQQTTRLIHCVLYLPHHDFQSAGISITLPCLESLVLRNGYGVKDSKGFLATLVVPALLRLDFQQRIFGSNPIDSLTSFISTSDCKLLQEVHMTQYTYKSTSRIGPRLLCGIPLHSEFFL
ncbi:hypothetical protein K438DRAFT_1844683 [Mycena galopus ATCC 62051]|nr:hypothetical protein K438DRAFT_1844683 [Mycena galopus ATCC 62051]